MERKFVKIGLITFHPIDEEAIKEEAIEEGFKKGLCFHISLNDKECHIRVLIGGDPSNGISIGTDSKEFSELPEEVQGDIIGELISFVSNTTREIKFDDDKPILQ